MASTVDREGARIWAQEILDERKVKAEMARQDPDEGAGNGRLGQLIRAADRLGLDHFSEAGGWLARSAAISAELGAIRNLLERERNAAIHALADGSAAVSDLLGLAAYRSVQSDGVAAQAVAAGIVECRGRAASAAASASAAVFAALQDRASGMVAESVRLAKTLPSGVSAEVDALRAGGQAADAWRGLEKCVSTYGQCHDLAQALGNEGWVDSADVFGDWGRMPSVWRYYIDPGRLDEQFSVLPRALRLARAAELGAGPGLFGMAECGARWVASERRKLEGVR